MSEISNVDLPFVETNKTRHGKRRFYLRIDGKRICRLPDDINGEEFPAAYWAGRKASRPTQDRHDAPKGKLMVTLPNSFRWLCMTYMATPEFKNLDSTTQDKRRNIIESMWSEPAGKTANRTLADIPLSLMTTKHIEALRDRKIATPFAADERLKVLRQIFETTNDGKPIAPNIAKMVKPFRQATDGHHTITSDEIGIFIDHHGPKSNAVLALSLMMFTGLRVSDLAAVGPQHCRGDILKLRLFKNRNRTPVNIELAVHPILEAVLAQHKVKGMTYLQTEFGKAFSVKGLGNRISDWFRQAGLPHCSSHSVRKGLATDQAHNAATDNMLEAMFGWKDGKTSKIYTRNADRARLARQAVAVINWDGMGSKLLAQE